MHRILSRIVLPAATAVALTMSGMSAASALPATTVSYDLSLAGKYAGAVRQGIQIWNGQLKNVQLKEVSAGTPGAVRVRLDPVEDAAPYYDSSVPEIVFTQKQIDPIQSDGKPYRDPVRTFVHESGHSLGLAHTGTSDCTFVMTPSPSGKPRGCHDYKTPKDREYTAVDKRQSTGGSLPATGGYVKPDTGKVENHTAARIS
ncbi:snapalysin family zinc-dependent metalloprotease [Pseudonocardiaceae bacterium YIM PH 21723]|nr:snapalysin family zinc-dependent metalloprotease [Pseudonocardiaceae bacterium YIM PH 21723]